MPSESQGDQGSIYFGVDQSGQRAFIKIYHIGHPMTEAQIAFYQKFPNLHEYLNTPKFLGFVKNGDKIIGLATSVIEGKDIVQIDTKLSTVQVKNFIASLLNFYLATGTVHGDLSETQIIKEEKTGKLFIIDPLGDPYIKYGGEPITMNSEFNEILYRISGYLPKNSKVELSAKVAAVMEDLDISLNDLVSRFVSIPD